MRLAELLTRIRFAGYHGDTKQGTRLYIENRVSLKTFNLAYREGERAAAAGVRCTCFDCTRPKKAS